MTSLNKRFHRAAEHVKTPIFWHDVALFTIMAVLAGCGLIYEYLLSLYAGRVLGAYETAIYTMIGIMIVAMGMGAFTARFVHAHFTGFAWLEAAIALLGSTAVLVIAAVVSFSYLLPQVIAENYGMPPDLVPAGGLLATIASAAQYFVYVMGFVLGFMIGMEIPLMARVRESLHQTYLAHNAGSIYGMDYIGAGIGAAIWVGFMLHLHLTIAASLTASANITMGLLFYFLYRKRIRFGKTLLLAQVLTAIVIVMVGIKGQHWDAAMEDMLYLDRVIYRMNTKFQHITITERLMNPLKPRVLTFYLNGRTQFASNDERIYHAMLVYPAMAASARHDKVLIIGGGDGLALRDVLRWNPKKVTLVDLDKSVIELFSKPKLVDGIVINKKLLELNKYAFSDPRVQVIFGDAYLKINALLKTGELYDTILVDLPDPSHPDLNKLYSSRFYAGLKQLLAGDGAIAVQSTSPYHAKNTFLCIGKTMAHAGFAHVDQYHHNVPSFGEWGWTVATRNGSSVKHRLDQLKTLAVDDGWTTLDVLQGAFAFGKDFFKDLPTIKINRLGSHVAYQYHRSDWEKRQGVYLPSDN